MAFNNFGGNGGFATVDRLGGGPGAENGRGFFRRMDDNDFFGGGFGGTNFNNGGGANFNNGQGTFNRAGNFNRGTNFDNTKYGTTTEAGPGWTTTTTTTGGGMTKKTSWSRTTGTGMEPETEAVEFTKTFGTDATGDNLFTDVNENIMTNGKTQRGPNDQQVVWTKTKDKTVNVDLNTRGCCYHIGYGALKQECCQRLAVQHDADWMTTRGQCKQVQRVERVGGLTVFKEGQACTSLPWGANLGTTPEPKTTWEAPVTQPEQPTWEAPTWEQPTWEQPPWTRPAPFVNQPTQQTCPSGCLKWFDGCNSCMCNGRTPYSCTRKWCSLRQTLKPACETWEIPQQPAERYNPRSWLTGALKWMQQNRLAVYIPHKAGVFKAGFFGWD